MNTNTLSTHPPQRDTLALELALPEHGTTVADRLSLRLGLWLLLRSHRNAQNRAERLERARALEHTRLLTEQEREADHARLLLATRAWR